MFTDDFFAIDVPICNIEVVKVCFPSAPRAGFYVRCRLGYFFFMYNEISKSTCLPVSSVKFIVVIPYFETPKQFYFFFFFLFRSLVN